MEVWVKDFQSHATSVVASLALLAKATGALLPRMALDIN